MKKFKSAIQIMDERPISMSDIDDIIKDFEESSRNLKRGVPYIKKHDNGMIEIFNGVLSIYTDGEGFKIFNDLMKKEGEKYAATNRK